LTQIFKKLPKIKVFDSNKVPEKSIPSEKVTEKNFSLKKVPEIKVSRWEKFPKKVSRCEKSSRKKTFGDDHVWQNVRGRFWQLMRPRDDVDLHPL